MRCRQAADAGIKVISYDRLIVGSPNVDYYATFDNFQVGVEQGTSLLHGLGVDQGKKGPFNIELFGGSADDTNAFYFYNGAMSVLQPQIDKGVLVVRVQADGHGQGRHAALGRRHRADAHGEPALGLLHQEACRRACCRPMTACRSASCRR